jgi:hypothetical protein
VLLVEFRDRVQKIASVEGNSFFDYNDIAAFNQIINESLAKFSIETECFGSDRITFTPTVGESSFDLRGAAFSQAIHNVRHVVIDGQPLSRLQSNLHGRASEEEAIQLLDPYNSEQGRPKTWWIENPSTLRFDRAFDQVYTNCYIAGDYIHPSLDDDNNELFFPSEMLLYAATYVAANIIRIGVSGEGLQNYTSLKGESVSEARAISNKMTGQGLGNQVRGYRKNNRYRLG